MNMQNLGSPTTTTLPLATTTANFEKMLITVVVMFVLCWSPYNVFYILTTLSGFLQYYYVNVIFIVSNCTNKRLGVFKKEKSNLHLLTCCSRSRNQFTKLNFPFLLVASK